MAAPKAADDLTSILHRYELSDDLRAELEQVRTAIVDGDEPDDEDDEDGIDGEVEYVVPVIATVEDGQVVKVVVCDEDVRLADTEDPNDPVVKVAENEPWPSWDLGS